MVASAKTPARQAAHGKKVVNGKACLPSDAACFEAFAQLWGVTELALLSVQSFLIPSFGFGVAQIVLIAISMLFPSRFTLFCSVLFRMVMHVVQAPFVWDSSFWDAQISLVIMAALLCCKRPGVVPAISWVARWQMGLFYVGAGFWKVNSAFLDPSSSCATIFVASLASMFPRHLLPWSLLGPALWTSPVLTVVTEMAMGVFLLLPSRRAQSAGVGLATLLHMLIAVTPFPNQVPTFGVFCVSRLFFVMPHAWTAAQAESLRVPKTAAGVLYYSTAIACAAASATLTGGPFVVNWAIPFHSLLCFLVARAIAINLGQRARTTPAQPPNSKHGILNIRNATLVICKYVALILSLSYTFAFHMLGLMDVSAVSPFSSIRMHGGSNHYLLPTAQLQARAPVVAKEHNLFSGGVVRVEACSSTYLNALYPGDISNDLPSGVRMILNQFGHTGRQFDPSVRRMLGADIRQYLSRWSDESGEPFLQYTVPALELRRMLAEVRAINESFRLVYVRLNGVTGDENWRKYSNGTKVQIDEDGKGGSTCRSKEAEEAPWGTCQANELAMLPPPDGLLMRMMVFFPYPVIDGVNELPCMD